MNNIWPSFPPYFQFDPHIKDQSKPSTIHLSCKPCKVGNTDDQVHRTMLFIVDKLKLNPELPCSPKKESIGGWWVLTSHYGGSFPANASDNKHRQALIQNVHASKVESLYEFGKKKNHLPETTSFNSVLLTVQCQLQFLQSWLP